MSKKKISLDKLYFGVVMPAMGYHSREDKRRLDIYNLFGSSRVMFSVARWVTMPKKEREKVGNPLTFLFGDVWGRVEYEFIVCPWPYAEEDTIDNSGVKVDIYQMYVKPNAEYLLSLVDKVSVSSAKRYLAEWRKVHKR